MFARKQLSPVVALLITLALSGCEGPRSTSEKPIERTHDKNVTPPAPSLLTADPHAPPAAAKEALPEAKPPEIMPDTHLAAGRLHESQGKYARAAEQYQQAVAMAPRQVEPYNRLGIVLGRLGRFKEADDAFLHAIKLAPREAHLRNNLAFSYILQSRWQDAEASLRETLAIKPDFARARVNLAMVLAQQERYDDALQQFSTALPKADAYYNLGLMYQSKRKLPEAARCFKSALEHNAKLTAAQNRLDTLPPDIVKSVTTLTGSTASPVARATEVPGAEKNARPEVSSTPTTTRPATAQTPPAIQAFGEIPPLDSTRSDVNSEPAPAPSTMAHPASEHKAENCPEAAPSLTGPPIEAMPVTDELQVSYLPPPAPEPTIDDLDLRLADLPDPMIDSPMLEMAPIAPTTIAAGLLSIEADASPAADVIDDAPATTDEPIVSLEDLLFARPPIAATLADLVTFQIEFELQETDAMRLHTPASVLDDPEFSAVMRAAASPLPPLPADADRPRREDEHETPAVSPDPET